MNKKLFTIPILASAVLIGLVVASAATNEASTFKLDDTFPDTLGKYSEALAEQRTPPQTPLLDRYSHNTTDLNLVEEITSIPVRTPKLLPEGYELKTVFYEIDSNGVAINKAIQYYMLESDQITDKTTFADVMDKGGFVIIAIDEGPDYDKENWLTSFGESKGGKFSTVGESSAILLENDGTQGKRSQVYFFDDTIKVDLVSVSLDAQTLLKIGQSMS